MNISDLFAPGVFFSEEYLKYIIHLPTFVWGFLAALILTPILGKLAVVLGITYKPHVKRHESDNDNPEKAIHDVETPSLGGLAVTFPLFVFTIVTFGFTEISVPFLITLGFLMLGAFLDEKYVLTGKAQLLIQIIAATIIAFSVINLSILTNPFGGVINLEWSSFGFTFLNIPWQFIFPGDFLLIIWILVCSVSLKMVGGSPALMESNSFVVFILLFILGMRTASDFVAINSLFAAGGLLGLIIFAFPPQKIFSGASGKAVFGFIIAVFAIINGAKFASTLLIILLPIIDFSFVLIKRMITHKVYNPIKLMKYNDTNHLHHQLIELGLSRRQVLFTECTITLFFGSIAVFSTGAIKLFLIIATAFIFFAGILLIHIFKNQLILKRKIAPKEESPEKRYGY